MSNTFKALTINHQIKSAIYNRGSDSWGYHLGFYSRVEDRMLPEAAHLLPLSTTITTTLL